MTHALFNIAHRGGTGVGPENSLAAIAHAVALGVDAIEIDLWAIDEQLWVTHDRRLGRNLPGEGRLEDLNATALAKLTLANQECLPTLDSVFALTKDKLLLNIELKGPNTAPLLCQWLMQQLQQGVSADNFLLSSFDHVQLLYCQQRLPHIRRGVLVEGIPLQLNALCQRLDAYSFNPSINFLNKELVRSAQLSGLKTYVYTVNEVDDWQWMVDLGVDGVFTDRPERLQTWNANNRR
ncbi:glycerophosphodiester phosphodiesterase [Simiduia litorea]|uniref:glycerophosphodiester phosphodiesterase n=1 Tax=Simiduia litorea TaxID=1435348 RepID=UPI0036F1C4B9